MTARRPSALPYDKERGRLRKLSKPERDAELGGKTMPCRMCGKPVPNNRFSYCGQPCRERANCWWSARTAIWNRGRDRVCACCGLDTDRLAEKIRRLDGLRRWLLTSLGRAHWGSCHYRHDGSSTYPRDPVLRAWKKKRGFNEGCALWDADHIVELADGGSRDPENVQCLCTPCHKRKTKAWHAAKKAARASSRSATRRT